MNHTENLIPTGLVYSFRTHMEHLKSMRFSPCSDTPLETLAQRYPACYSCDGRALLEDPSDPNFYYSAETLTPLSKSGATTPEAYQPYRLFGSDLPVDTLKIARSTYDALIRMGFLPDPKTRPSFDDFLDDFTQSLGKEYGRKSSQTHSKYSNKSRSSSPSPYTQKQAWDALHDRPSNLYDPLSDDTEEDSSFAPADLPFGAPDGLVDPDLPF